jgi:pyruvate formate lyase activating enzyme
MLESAATCRVFDVQRFSVHDGPGIRTIVFLEGCPLRCAWCQNPEGFRTGDAPAMSTAAVIAEVLKDRDYYALSGGGVTLSGGEPLLHPASVRALLAEAKRYGLHTCVQTSGAVPRASVEAVLGLVDLFQFDLKHMDAQRHRELTGADCERLQQNAAFLLERLATVQFRMPLVPGVNDDARNLDAVAQFLVGHGVHALRLVPYQRMYLEKYAALGLQAGVQGIEPPSAATLARVTEQLMQRNVTVQIDGWAATTDDAEAKQPRSQHRRNTELSQ